ncbi:myosin-2 heavy chain-like isoform X2 [Stegodyphus dumicola]|uniref:myosin-2 heavy chain-like isoform X2 n=1 Tax=Stegodyphus dumicola TaxID=202533 RepID=UPI0015AF0072|nr:myosin-2 heavy chain-like isoform X2 [Stegodyphus dumicola]
MENSSEQFSKQISSNSHQNSVSRTHSQDPLDSSSASSLSAFADHSDQNMHSGGHDSLSHAQKSEETSPRASMDEALKSEKAFIEFVMSLPAKEPSEHHRSADSVSIKSKTQVPGPSKVGLDHLDNLCKLMEQLSELRDTNNKLQKRVQYLEDLKTLHDMHKEINEDAQYSSEDALSNKRRPYELTKSATETFCPKKEESHVTITSRSSSKYLSRRSRHQSTGGQRRERSKSVGHEDACEDTKSKRIFPKWSKVKEAFGWERRCSDETRGSIRHPGSPTWYQDDISFHSSDEDVNEDLEPDQLKRASVASEKYVAHLETPVDQLRRQKSTPSPGSDKLTSYREALELKPKSSTIERDSYTNQDYAKFDKDDSKRGKSPWGRVKTIIERRRDSLKRRSLRRDHLCTDCDSLAKGTVDPLDLKPCEECSECASRQQVEHQKRKSSKPAPISIDQEGDSGGPRTPSSSPTFHRKSRWTKVKKVLKGKKEEEKDPTSVSTPTSPNCTQDGNFPFDVIEEMSQGSYEDSREIPRVGSDSHVHQMALTAPTSELMLQLQRNLSEDFHRKIEEWDRIRSAGHTSCSPHWDRKAPETARARKKSDRYEKTMKPKLKDLSWLEKELQKIEKEKQRLSKERQKYEERALRLEKLKETVLSASSSNKREVLVKTAAGEFRFEGISDAFTKKLYEWETKRGVRPELSTIALLDSSRLSVQPSLIPKAGALQRVVSRSESSIADIGQPSHNSSNSLPSLKLPDTLDTERQNHPSRANSEPDLSTLVALTNGTNISVSSLSRNVGDSLEDELAEPGVNKESEEDDLDKRRKDSETYYGLLEENVILLEQLKDKEEICRRLEKELEMLDAKVDVMNQHHMQETERYREKLWEMHKPGATPRDVQCCLHTMAQLRKRIDVLERYTEKLRNDRESVEDSFRYHSKQQENMTLDLLEKMRELQAAGSNTEDNETKAPVSSHAEAIERLQDLSALLVKQTQDLEEMLSQKTRQICQLRWELLHRDLSTVKLETELHTHTAHRKRSKYAHFRSHSSEEASAYLPTQGEDLSNRMTATEAFYEALPLTEFKATQLSNTVQQLSREVLKLTSAADYSKGSCKDSQMAIASTNAENSRMKRKSQAATMDQRKQITVRRNSAENISIISANEDSWKENSSSSAESEVSSDDDYTRVAWRPVPMSPANADAERLLMSYGEHPPRGYTQRRKKLQKVAINCSSTGRRRSNTFHIQRNLERSSDKRPQKCQSFRLPRISYLQEIEGRSNLSDSNLNFKNLCRDIRNQERIRNQLAKCQSIRGESSDIAQVASLVKDNNKLLREVASDSKIPFLIQVQRCLSERAAQNKESPKLPNRSMSDKHRKETVTERREQFQKKRSKKRLKPPESLSSTDHSDNMFQQSIASENYTSQGIALVNGKKSTKQKELIPVYEEDRNITTKPNKLIDQSHSTNQSINNDATTVTIQLPKRKLRNAVKCFRDTKETEEQIVTIVMPKKRSLSSEQDSSVSESSSKESSRIITEGKSDVSCEVFLQKTTDKHSLTNSNNKNNCIKMREAQKDLKFYDPQSFNKDNFPKHSNVKTITHELVQTQLLPQDRLNEEPERFVKAADVNDTNKILNCEFNKVQAATESKDIGKSDNLYVKSPSAPQLDWRKVGPKNLSCEGATNVKALIERYNQKVIESQSPTSPLSSNVSSPITERKVSTNFHSTKSIPPVITHSCSTPNTPSILYASAYYNPVIFKPTNLDFFPATPPSSPNSSARSEAVRKAKEHFISSPVSTSLPVSFRTDQSNFGLSSTQKYGDTHSPETDLSLQHTQHDARFKTISTTRRDEDTLSNSSIDSMSLVVFRTGENCQESRLSKRTSDYQKSGSQTIEGNNLKTSKSLSNSSLFKSVLSSDFKMPSSFLKLRRSKRKKDMATVSQLCRQSLLLTDEGISELPHPASHKSCPSSPDLKPKGSSKSSWFHRNLFGHK